MYIGKVDKRQGITRNPEVTVMQRIGNASFYSGSRPDGLTKTEQLLIQHAKTDLKEALSATNTFFNGEWNDYRAKMEEVSLSPFKETKTFTLTN